MTPEEKREALRAYMFEYHATWTFRSSSPRARAQSAKYYAANRERIAARSAKRYAANPGRARAQSAKYYAANPQAVRARATEYGATRQAATARAAVRSYARWSAAEDVVVMDASLTAVEIAFRLGRTYASVAGRRAALRKAVSA